MMVKVVYNFRSVGVITIFAVFAVHKAAQECARERESECAYVSVCVCVCAPTLYKLQCFIFLRNTVSLMIRACSRSRKSHFIRGVASSLGQLSACNKCWWHLITQAAGRECERVDSVYA